MKMEQIECSETSAYKIQTSGNYPEKSIQYSEHGESLKSRILFLTLSLSFLLILLDLRVFLMAERRAKGIHKINRNVECNILTITTVYCACSVSKEYKEGFKKLPISRDKSHKGLYESLSH